MADVTKDTVRMIVDTTLRDGEQRAGLAFSPKDKAACAKIMDAIGIFQIEAGIPAIGNREKEAVCAVKAACRHAKVSVWCRMVENDIREAFDCRPDFIHIGVPVSDLQIKTKLCKDRAFIKEQLHRCAETALCAGYAVSLGFEDASRADIDFVAELAKLALSLGIRRVRYADTVGVAAPHKIARDITALAATGVQAEIHAHDDLGLAVANTLEAAKNGALYADTTFFGIGERAGNCDFNRFVEASGSLFDLGVHTDSYTLFQAHREISGILGLTAGDPGVV